MEFEGGDIIFICIVTMILTFAGTYLSLDMFDESEAKELGQAICTEKGLGEYVSFDDKVLTCKDAEQLKYDGIRIEVK